MNQIKSYTSLKEYELIFNQPPENKIIFKGLLNQFQLIVKS
jgi:hypothetical protein